MRALLASPSLRKDRGFNSLFAAYASTQRKSCGKCRKKPSMLTCRTLLGSLIVKKRALLETTFGLDSTAALKVNCSGRNIEIRVG